MLLAKVAVFLGTSFLWDSDHSVGTRLLCTLFLTVQSFLIARSVGSFLATYTLNSLERQEKQTHVHRNPTFLIKVELILPLAWTHLENVTHQISLGKENVQRNHGCLQAWAVVPVGQLQDVGVELLHMLHKLMDADTLGFLQHVRDTVPLLLSHAIGEHGEEVKHHTVFKRLAQKSHGSLFS
jgi:hypothetical protein